jgi:uncharacterized tellurite resistance protein B-like protein
VPANLLADVAVVALAVAHGMDADLDPRESRVVIERLSASAVVLTGEPVSMAELSHHVELAVARYGRLTVPELEALVAATGEALGPDRRAEAFAILVGVAEADGVVRTMEQTVLRHIATAWGVAAPD